MGRDRQVPTVDSIIKDLSERVGILERKLQQTVDARRDPYLISFDGLISDFVGIETGPIPIIYPTEFDLMIPILRVAPSGADVTINLTLYGPTTGVVRTLTIPDGLQYSQDAVPFIVPAGGALTATPTGADSGTAEDLVIALLPRLL